MALSVRWNTMSAIIASTTFICLQDLTKKGMVFRNFASSLGQDESDGTQVEKKTAFQTLKSKWQNYKQELKEIKQKGNGSYFSGFKKTYEQYDNNDGQEHIRLQTVMNKYEKSKQFTKKVKEQGEGSYYKGLKKMYNEYKQQKLAKSTNPQPPSSQPAQPAQPTQPSYLSKKMTDAKNAVVQKYKSTTDLYKKASQQKSQKLIMKHLYFGGLAICGTIIAPRAYLLLNVAYFAAYQVYYFSDVINQKKKYKFLEDMRFQPLWTAFMVSGVGIFGLHIAKIVRSV